MNCLHKMIRSRTLLLSVALASAGWCAVGRADGGKGVKNNKPAARPARVQAVRVRLQVRKIQAAQPKKAKRLPAGKRRIQRAARFIPFFGGGGFGFAGRSTKAGALHLAQVQDELHLTDAQKTKVGEIFKSHQQQIRKLFGGLQGLKPDERRKKMTEIRKKMQKSSAEMAKAIEGVLKPAQARRLDEIFLQLHGLRALQDGSVAKRLKLTAEQKTKIADLFKSQASRQRDLYRGLRGKGLTPDQRRKKYKEIREKRQKLVKETEQKVTAVMTEQQQAQLKKMKGKEFKLDRKRLFRRATNLKRKVKRTGPKTAA